MMKSTSVPLFLWLSIMLNGFHTAQAKAVFAHFMVGSCPYIVQSCNNLTAFSNDV